MVAERVSRAMRVRVLRFGLETEILRLALSALASHFEIEHRPVSDAVGLQAALHEGEWDALLCDPSGHEADWAAILPLVWESGSDLVAVALTDREDDSLVAQLGALGAHALLGRSALEQLVPIVARELAMARRRRLTELRSLVDSSPEPMLIADTEGRIRHANRLLEHLLGYAEAELAGQPVEVLVPEHLRAAHVAERARYAQAPVPRPMGSGRELLARHKDGTLIPVEISFGPVRLGGAQLVCCGLRDLRERVRAERLLRAILEGTAAHTGEEFLRALVRNLALALQVRHAFVSELLPQPPARARVLAFWDGTDFAPPCVHELATGPCAEVLRDGELFVRDGLRARFGDDRWLQERGCESFFGVRLLGARGEPLGVLAIASVAPLADGTVVRDVMRIFAARAAAELDRARIAARLAERERWLRDMVELSADWYWEQDENFRFIAPRHEGEPSDPEAAWFVGKTRWEVAPEALTAAQWAEHRRALEAHEEFRNLEYALRLPDGRLRWLSVSGHPVYDPEGSFRGYRGIAKDITARKHIEEALRASETRFREIFHQAPDAMTLVRPADATYLDVNLAFEEMTGWRRAEVLGRTSRDIGLWAEPARREQMFQDLAREGTLRDLEYAMRRRDGTIIHTALNARTLQLTGERCYLFVIRDITARRRAEDALRESEAQLRLIADHLPAMILDIGTDGRLRFANRAVADFCGATGERLEGRRLDEVLAPPLCAAWRPFLARALGGEEIHWRDARRGRPDGSLRDLDITLVPRRDAAGRVSGVVTLAVDVTARRRLEEELQLANRALDASIHAVLITRSSADDHKIVYVNPAFERITGYCAAEAIGRNPRFLHGPQPDQPELDTLRAALREQREATVLVRNFRKDGTPFWSELRVAPVRDSAGTVTHYVGISADVTDRVEAQQRLRELAAELERRVEERTGELRAAMRELESFSYTVSHDLRAPLRAIAGFAHLLREERGAMLGDEGLRLIDRIEANAMHMAALIDGLLALAQHSRRPLDKKPVDVGSLVGEVLGSLRQELQALDAEVVVAELPACHADPVLLRQVFANLLSNAMKYSAMRKPPRIEIGAREERGETVYWVRDNGVGFDMRYAQRMFRPFERMHPASEFPGIGIGLSIVRRIVERHGGRIWAESAPGEGATFSFTLGPDRASGAGRSG